MMALISLWIAGLLIKNVCVTLFDKIIVLSANLGCKSHCFVSSAA